MLRASHVVGRDRPDQDAYLSERRPGSDVDKQGTRIRTPFVIHHHLRSQSFPFLPSSKCPRASDTRHIPLPSSDDHRAPCAPTPVSLFGSSVTRLHQFFCLHLPLFVGNRIRSLLSAFFLYSAACYNTRRPKQGAYFTGKWRSPLLD